MRKSKQEGKIIMDKFYVEEYAKAKERGASQHHLKTLKFLSEINGSDSTRQKEVVLGVKYYCGDSHLNALEIILSKMWISGVEHAMKHPNNVKAGGCVRPEVKKREDR